MSKIIMRIITGLLFCVMIFSGVMIVREKLRAQKEIAELTSLLLSSTAKQQLPKKPKLKQKLMRKVKRISPLKRSQLPFSSVISSLCLIRIPIA